MSLSSYTPFPRRLDPHGTYHSTCPTCFQAIGTSFSDDVLAEAEKQHNCDEPRAFLRMLGSHRE